MAHDVFISHATEDKVIADAVCATLEQQNIRCWIAPRDIPPGSDWGEAIVNGIKHAKVFVLVFSRQANTSPHIPREVERAVSRGLPVIPLRIENVVPEGSLEYNLASVHWLDALTPPVEAHIRRLVETIRALLILHPDAHVPAESAVPVVAPMPPIAVPPPAPMPPAASAPSPSAPPIARPSKSTARIAGIPLIPAIVVGVLVLVVFGAMGYQFWYGNSAENVASAGRRLQEQQQSRPRADTPPPATPSDPAPTFGAPSGSSRSHRIGNVLTLAAPANWQPFKTGNPYGIGAPGGVDGTFIKYGLMIGIHELRPDVTLEDQTDDLNDSFFNSNPHLKVVRTSTDRLAGARALVTIAEGMTQFGYTERTTMYTLITQTPYGRAFVYYQEVVPVSEYAAAQRVFRAIRESLIVDH